MTMTKSDQTPGADLSTGPELSAAESGVTDRAVHIIFVPLTVADGQFDGQGVTALGQTEIAPHIGHPLQRDVIVFAGRPWHFAGNLLQPHPQVHTLFPDSILKLHRARPEGPERAVWWSEHNFDITTIADEAAHHAGTAPVDAVPYPFETRPVTRPEQGIDGKSIFVARSTVPVATGKYKISFFMEGLLIDPNMHCL